MRLNQYLSASSFAGLIFLQALRCKTKVDNAVACNNFTTEFQCSKVLAENLRKRKVINFKINQAKLQTSPSKGKVRLKTIGLFGDIRK